MVERAYLVPRTEIRMQDSPGGHHEHVEIEVAPVAVEYVPFEEQIKAQLSTTTMNYSSGGYCFRQVKKQVNLQRRSWMVHLLCTTYTLSLR